MKTTVFRAVANQSLRGSLRIRRRHRWPLAIALVLVPLVMASIPDIQKNSDRFRRYVAATQQEAEITEHLKLKQDALTERSKVADARLQQGCNVIPNIFGKDGRIASLAEGQQVINPDNNAPFPAGSIACDVYGGTAIVGENGMLGAIAVTTNYDLVKAALAMHGLKMQAGNPNITAAQGSQTQPGVIQP